MENQEKGPKEKKKTTKLIIGIILIIGGLFGNNFSRLSDWGTPENIGFNAFAVALLSVSAYLIYSGLKKD